MTDTITSDTLEAFTDEFPGVPVEVLEELIDNHTGYTPDEIVYEGEADSFKHLAEQMVDAGLYGEIPEALTYYIDCSAIGRDLDAGGMYEVRHNFTGYYWSVT